jgi:hypothetical protein
MDSLGRSRNTLPHNRIAKRRRALIVTALKKGSEPPRFQNFQLAISPDPSDGLSGPQPGLGENNEFEHSFGAWRNRAFARDRRASSSSGPWEMWLKDRAISPRQRSRISARL